MVYFKEYLRLVGLSITVSTVSRYSIIIDEDYMKQGQLEIGHKGMGL